MNSNEARKFLAENKSAKLVNKKTQAVVENAAGGLIDVVDDGKTGRMPPGLFVSTYKKHEFVEQKAVAKEKTDK